jgi:hypothetical protein
MLKRRQLILVFILVFSGAFYLGNVPAGAQSTAVTGVTVDDGRIVTSVSGQTPIDPCYRDPTTGECVPMTPAEKLWFCVGDPSLGQCREFTYSSLCFAYNCYATIGGRKIYYSCPK